MRPLGTLLLAATILAGCDSGKEVVAAGRDCTTIVSPLERLACFDAAAGTPPTTPTHATPPLAPKVEQPVPTRVPDIVLFVQRNESRRKTEQTGMLLLRAEDSLPGRSRVVISSPALGGTEPRPLLAISCLQNISRLQLLTAQPLDVNRVNIRVLLDGRPIAESRPWQVLEDGTVTDAGRGLVAIEQLRHLTRPAQQLQLESDYPQFDGLSFDASALHELMGQQREACHW
ncbi:Type VI secretion protein VasI [Pseudomonas chlororaphis subsp. aureofaciens]|uniref:type VI secretion system-associated protein VasI n=1 Tax=Pseudomonas chlororaphis TaxID=587753 RepID=UPI000F6C1FE6|nr:type VI secretion system-associated protein VasI [Pseudomonas chlororaphis]AZD86902.1 Type VI secretion protein VasI [Pseudomonas chlororaphis subsp. aureofaciens]